MSFVFKGLNLNNVKQLIFVMVKCGVLFEVWYEYLNKIWTSFVSKGLNLINVNQLIFVMVKCGVLFEVRTEFLNNM
jgi:predicted Holliday junction resolvase-like endonuclease